MVVLLIGGAVPPAAQSILVSETLLTFDATNEYDAVLSGADLVYTSEQRGSLDILYIDSSGFASGLVLGSGDQYDADLDEGLVVYVDNSSGNSNIHYLDLIGGREKVEGPWALGVFLPRLERIRGLPGAVMCMSANPDPCYSPARRYHDEGGGAERRGRRRVDPAFPRTWRTPGPN